MHVLVTGGNGFVAAHIIEALLSHGHTVTTSVRTAAKAKLLTDAYPGISTVIVPDISATGAFDDAVQTSPALDAIIHTASPVPSSEVKDVQKDLLDPAVIGTTGVLRAAAKHASSVKHVVVTSSFAAVWNHDLPQGPETTYTEASWSDATMEKCLANPAGYGYRTSKALSERSAWDFVEKEKPGFTLAVINPPMVFGPIRFADSLDAMNTSSHAVRNALTGAWKNELNPPFVPYGVDVRDVALAHVIALEGSAGEGKLAGKRFIVSAGQYDYKQVTDIIRKNYPQFQDVLPSEEIAKGGLHPESGIFGLDNTRARTELGIKFRSFEESITGLVDSVLKFF